MGIYLIDLYMVSNRLLYGRWTQPGSRRWASTSPAASSRSVPSSTLDWSNGAIDWRDRVRDRLICSKLGPDWLICSNFGLDWLIFSKFADPTRRAALGLYFSRGFVEVRFCLTECVYQFVLDSQLPRKIVDLLFTITHQISS